MGQRGPARVTPLGDRLRFVLPRRVHHEDPVPVGEELPPVPVGVGGALVRLLAQHVELVQVARQLRRQVDQLARPGPLVAAGDDGVDGACPDPGEPLVVQAVLQLGQAARGGLGEDRGEARLEGVQQRLEQRHPGLVAGP